jgi:acetyl esterase/lipase/lysophospholipase L1-like esterase
MFGIDPERLLLLVFSLMSAENPQASPDCFSLEGQPVAPVNFPEDGLVKDFHAPRLQLFRSASAAPRGTVLLFPGGGYNVLETTREGANTARFLNTQGFDVAVLEYHIAPGPQPLGSQGRELALADALQAYRLLKTSAASLGVHSGRLALMGYSAGGHLAARTAQQLGLDEQPDDVILVYPAYLQETLPGTVAPAVMPPKTPGRLFALIASNDNADWVNSCQQYVKIWKGYDGSATFHLLPEAGHGFGMESTVAASAQQWPCLLQAYLAAQPETPADPNPAAVPTAGDNTARHAEKVAAAASGKFDLILVGDSITNNFENPEYQPVWNQFFAPRRALNLGYSGYRTENVLWNVQNGELAGQSPKVMTLMVGTNNVDEKNYPTRHTAGQVAGGIEAILKVMRAQCPAAKIILLACFPGSYDGPKPTSHRAILERASELIRPLADNEHVFFLDVNRIFLTPEGAVDQALMGDFLHPTPAGAKLWAQTMEPLLARLMGEASRDTEVTSI